MVMFLSRGVSQKCGYVCFTWCVTEVWLCLFHNRHNLLGSLLRDSCALSLYHVQHTLVGNDEIEPTVLERSVQPGASNPITSFSWHPTHENRLLTIAQSGTLTRLHNTRFVSRSLFNQVSEKLRIVFVWHLTTAIH